MSNQEVLIESLTERLSLNSPTQETQSKTVRLIESKMKQIYDNLNVQQNSIDNLFYR